MYISTIKTIIKNLAAVLEDAEKNISAAAAKITAPAPVSPELEKARAQARAILMSRASEATVSLCENMVKISELILEIVGTEEALAVIGYKDNIPVVTPEINASSLN
ncbi:MAG: hypothetical protein A4E53_00269 [Pelotomaculum sp. PtaB.Bin104]|nr:MAG: hypothetical protein A4E53_00269 [Pelotomaculum sp. PtaB.Bin104]